jgi:hypothetical protein
MSREITDDTPTVLRNIHGFKFEMFTPYTAGDVLNAEEANTINQTRCENLRNNLADAIWQAKEQAEKDGAPIDQAALQKLVTDYDLTYEFGVRRGGGGRIGDPVESEAMDMARELVREAFKKRGTAIKDIPGGTPRVTELAREVLDKHPQIRQRAAAVVEARNAVASNLGIDASSISIE